MTRLIKSALFYALCVLLLAAPTQAANTGMVAAAHPLAAQAGRTILAQGGTAIDAAIAIQAVLGLVEPQSSGLAGGGFLLHYAADTHTLTSWDGRETAPAAMRPDAFAPFATRTTTAQTKENFYRAVTSGLATGVPGVAAMFAQAHQKHGRLNWAHLFAPATRLAEQGFAVTPRLHYLIAHDPVLADDADARAYFFTPEKKPHPVGHILKNPAYAETLRRLARHGAADFYTAAPHSTGGKMLARLAQTASVMTPQDLATYRAKQRPALCAPYRAYKICSIGPPSSGGVALLQMLGLLSRFDMAAHAPNSTAAIHLISEAARLAFADRARYLADADFVHVPVAALLAPDYLARRAALIRPNKRLPHARAGQPQGAQPRADNFAPPSISTTHFVVRDRYGNAVSMTSSVESAFGARQMAAGMMLNNQLTDFSFLPTRKGKPVANAVAGGKRPRSSMTPVMIFNPHDQLVGLLGSPGGPRIIGYVAQTIIALIDAQMDMQAAIDLPHHISYRGQIELETGADWRTQKTALEKLGHKIILRRQPSGLHGLWLKNGAWQGGADSRREGVVLKLRRAPQ